MPRQSDRAEATGTFSMIFSISHLLTEAAPLFLATQIQSKHTETILVAILFYQ